jgi:hypothetical protein
VLVFHDAKLIDCEPVVRLDVIEVHDPCLRAADVPGGGAVLDGHAIHQQVMHAAVSRRRLCAHGPGEFAGGIFQRLGGQLGVESCKCVPQALFQHDLGVIGALRGRFAGGDFGAIADHPTGAFEPGEGGLLDDTLRELIAVHNCASSSVTSLVW